MLANIMNYWRPPDRFQKLWEKATAGRENFDKDAIKLLSHGFIHDGYLERGQRRELTGEWIVFAKQDGVNYYLTLGAHGDDEAIWRRCKACAVEFPEVRILQETR